MMIRGMQMRETDSGISALQVCVKVSVLSDGCDTCHQRHLVSTSLTTSRFPSRVFGE
jgi:hypothetical protein